MHLELEPDEVGKDGRAARLRFDGGGTLAGFGADDREAVGIDGQLVSNYLVASRFYRWERCERLGGKERMDSGRDDAVFRDDTYGTMLGPAEGRYQLKAFTFMKRGEMVLPFHTDRARSAFVGFIAVYALGALSLKQFLAPRQTLVVVEDAKQSSSSSVLFCHTKTHQAI